MLLHEESKRAVATCHTRAYSPSCTRAPMEADQDDEVEASRLAALLGFLQSWDYAAESMAQHLIGERAGWALVTALEAWKASCRLRLLSHVGDGRLMGSFSSSGGQETAGR